MKSKGKTKATLFLPNGKYFYIVEIKDGWEIVLGIIPNMPVLGSVLSDGVEAFKVVKIENNYVYIERVVKRG